jgi:hypothetical protein
MTSPVTKQKKSKPVPAVKLRDWCCGTPITGVHAPGCAYERRADEPVDYTGPVDVAPAVEDAPQPQAPEPPPTPPTEVPAAASPRSYGIRKTGEDDLALPSGSFVRYRKLNPGQLLELNLVEVLDGFTPQLLADVQSGDEAAVEEAFMKAVVDPERNAKIFGPTDRVVAATVIIPKVVMDGPTTDSQVNVKDIDFGDKLVIFAAAVGEQLTALKSVRDESSSGV